MTDTTMAAPARPELPGDRTKFSLDETAMPRAWYNIQADLPTPAPPVLHPGTGQPIGPADLAPLFPMEIIRQEVSQERYIDIPEEIRAVYRLLFGRAPAPEEIALGQRFLQGVREVHTAQASLTSAQPTAGLTPWEEYVQTLLMTNEFCFVD